MLSEKLQNYRIKYVIRKRRRWSENVQGWLRGREQAGGTHQIWWSNYILHTLHFLDTFNRTSSDIRWWSNYISQIHLIKFHQQISNDDKIIFWGREVPHINYISQIHSSDIRWWSNMLLSLLGMKGGLANGNRQVLVINCPEGTRQVSEDFTLLNIYKNWAEITKWPKWSKSTKCKI